MSYRNRNGNDWPNKYNGNSYNEKIDPWSNLPNDNSQSDINYNYYNNNHRNNFFNQDRCRQRESNNYYDQCYRNNRSRGRRSSSAPRTLSDSYNEPNMNWSNRNNNFRRTRRNSFSQNIDNSDNESEDIERNNSPIKNVKQLKGFKSIFSEKKVIDNTSNIKGSLNDLIHTEKNVRSKRIVYEMKNKPIINISIPEKKPDVPKVDNIKIKNVDKIQKEIKTKESKQDITKYYGQSLSNNIKTDLKVELPIIDWPKKSFTIDNIPKYHRENIVGGDGISLELYYMCKYCCMFTDHSQINNHLKSKYHYDKYIEYLKNGFVVSDNSSISSSNSSSESKDDKLSQDNNQNLIPSNNINKIKQSNTDVDTSDLLFNIHEELDYNEDTD